MTLPAKRPQFFGLTPTVLALIMVSLLMKASSEVVAPTDPVIS